MRFLERPLQKALFTGSLLTSIVLSTACGTAATPSPTSTPTSTPPPTAAVQLQKPIIQATPANTPTATPYPASTSVIQLQRPPTPVSTKIPVPTLTPTPQAPFKSEKFNRLINFVEKNYFKVPANYISLVYSKDDLSDITDVSLGIPFVEAFSIVDRYTHYNFFYVGSNTVNTFPQFKDQFLGRGWKTYQGGVFGQNGRFYDTWVRFEDERFVTITIRRDVAGLATAVDSYLFNKPSAALDKSIIDKAYGIIPKKFDNKVSGVFMITDKRRREVGATFKDSEGSFTMRVRDDAKIEDDLGFVLNMAVKDYGELRLGNYSTRTVAIESEGRTRTQSFFYCRTGIYCKVDADWSLLPSPIGIKNRLEDYLKLLPSFFDEN